MARHAAEAGASFFAAGPLFLKPCSRPTYLSFVREHFPSLIPDYHRRFDHADFADPEYARKLHETVDRACRRHGLKRRFSDSDESLLSSPGTTDRKPPQNANLPEQQWLFG
jgi:hypothetical protein